MSVSENSPPNASAPPAEGGPIVLSPYQKIPGSGPPSPAGRGDRNPDDVIERRRTAIVIIRDNFFMQKKISNDRQVLEELKKQGFDISRDTLKRDMIVIDKDNHFVLNLAAHNYNRIIENMFDNMELIIEDMNAIIARKWTSSKIITTHSMAGDGGTETVQKVVTDELAGPRLKANEIKGQMMKLYADIFKGGIVDAGIALAQRNANKFKKQYDDLLAASKAKDELIEELKAGVVKEQ